MHHGITVPPNVRDSVLPPSSGDKPSRFGVLFERELEQPDDFVLGMLGRSGGRMQDAGLMQQTEAGDILTLPAGFTFFGQFVDHDMTLMSLPPVLGTPQDLISVINLRTPKLDLDTVFGKGPADPDSAKFYDPATLKLRLDENGRDIVRSGLDPSHRTGEPPERAGWPGTTTGTPRQSVPPPSRVGAPLRAGVMPPQGGSHGIRRRGRPGVVPASPPPHAGPRAVEGRIGAQAPRIQGGAEHVSERT